MKVGVIGSEPPGFYNVLASSYDAERFSAAELMGDLATPGADASVLRQQSREAALRRIQASLKLGENVLFDTFVNRYGFRTRLRNIAANSGAVAVTLVMDTHPKTIERHLRETYPAAVAERYMETARKMYGGLKRPNAREPHLDLRGELETPELLQHVAAHLLELQQLNPSSS